MTKFGLAFFKWWWGTCNTPPPHTSLTIHPEITCIANNDPSPTTKVVSDLPFPFNPPRDPSGMTSDCPYKQPHTQTALDCPSVDA